MTLAAVAIAALLPASGLPAQQQNARQGERGWEFRPASTIRFIRPVLAAPAPTPSWVEVSAVPLVLVVTSDSLVALDARTGNIAWSRRDLDHFTEDQLLLFGGTGLAMVEQVGADVMLSLRTGETLWRSSRLPLKSIRMYVGMPLTGRLLAIGRDSANRKAVVCVRLLDGHVEWTQRGIWQYDPGGMWTPPRMQRAFYYEPPIIGGDSTAILYVSYDGPTRLNFVTGEVVWVARPFRLKEPPLVAPLGEHQAHAPWMMRGGRLFVPVERRLTAVDLVSGDTTWSVKTPARVSAMMSLDSTVVLQMDEDIGTSFERREIRSGAMVWSQRPFTRGDGTPFVYFAGADLFFASGLKLVGVSLDNGALRDVGKLDFQAEERPELVQYREGSGAVFASEQNIALLGSDGTVRYSLFVSNPSRKLQRTLRTISALVATANLALSMRSYAQVTTQSANLPIGAQERISEGLGNMMSSSFAALGSVEALNAEMDRMGQWIGETNLAAGYAFFLTKQPTETGANSWCLRQIDTGTGADVDRIWLAARPENVRVDSLLRQAYVQFDEHRIAAIPVGIRAPNPPSRDGPNR